MWFLFNICFYGLYGWYLFFSIFFEWFIMKDGFFWFLLFEVIEINMVNLL